MRRSEVVEHFTLGSLFIFFTLGNCILFLYAHLERNDESVFGMVDLNSQSNGLYWRYRLIQTNAVPSLALAVF